LSQGYSNIKSVFSASLLQSSVSHGPSESIICGFAAQETFIVIIVIIIDVVLLSIIVETVVIVFFRIL